MTDKRGRFIVSLDFEKLWGVIDIDSYESYKSNVAGVDSVFPRIISLSDEYDIKLTVGVVGLLMCQDKSDINKYKPKHIPTYSDTKMQPYGEYMEKKVGESDKTDRLHFAKDLISQIHNPHEIASHTFCHYYCNAEGQNREQFEDDIASAVAIAKDNGISLKSIIFPRNECRENYLDICCKYGITNFRGNERNWLHDESIHVPKYLSQIRRALRLADTYLNISGHNCSDIADLKTGEMTNIRASRFLRAYSPIMKIFDGLKLRRICKDMTHAAKNGLIYHLWWHPHNFGVYQDENLFFLEKIYRHYDYLSKSYGFISATFSDISMESINGQ